MNPQTASRTALATSLMRALHGRIDPRPILDDPWGDRLMPGAARMQVYQAIRNVRPELPATPDVATMQRAIDGALRANSAYANVILRSRFTEDALRRAMARGIRQYVLVGAGFDSYALRRPPAAADLTVIDRATLRAVSSVAAPGSEVVFSYIGSRSARTRRCCSATTPKGRTAS